MPEDPVHILCEQCGHRGRHRRATLLRAFGQDEAMPDVLHAIANCPRYRNPCIVVFERIPKA